MGFSYNVNVLNQKGSPAIYTDTFANRPAFGYAGRLFISNDTAAIYEDTGTAWVLIANVSSGAGTLQQVTTNGNTSNVGISVTAGGISTNSATITSLTQGSVPFVGAAGLITQDNANLFFDDTNNRLGINTNTPSNNLDVHGTGTTALLALNNTSSNQSLISFLKNSSAKWRIGNSSTDTFDILNVGLTTNAITISSASNSVSFLASIKIQQGAGFAGIAGFNGIGCDAGGFFFQIGTNTSNPYFNFIGLTGARTYTYPDATGTIALTSNLSSYLPLTGGTLTGPLNGTSASLTGNVLARNGSSGQAFVTTNGSNADFVIETVSDGTTKLNTTGNKLAIASGAGNVLIGSTTDDTINKLQVTGKIKATSFNSDKGNSGNLPNVTATTIFTLSTVGMYLVNAFLVAGAGDINYASFATILYDGVVSRIVANNGTLLTLSLAGNNVQVAQASGGAQGAGANWTFTIV